MSQSHGHFSGVFCAGLVQGDVLLRRKSFVSDFYLILGGPETSQQDQLKEIRDKGRTNRTTGSRTESSVDLQGRFRVQFEL